MSVASANFPEQRCRLIVQRLLPILLLALLVIITCFCRGCAIRCGALSIPQDCASNDERQPWQTPLDR
jgi:hypothetical protein